MSGPTVELRGNLGANPDLRSTPNGKTVCTVSVAATPRRKIGDNQYEDLETIWFRVTCWDSLAEHVAESLRKGDKVVVHGFLEQETWTREDGSSSVSLRVRATGFGVDLGRSPVLVKRPIREVAEPAPWSGTSEDAAPAADDGELLGTQAA